MLFIKFSMMIQNFNIHTHTWRCGHAYGKDTEYIESAIQAGFKTLGFSEHIQYREDNGKYNRIDYEDYYKYFDDIFELRKQYSGQIDILCGLEAEYIPEVMDELLEFIPFCDYVLLGQHKGGLKNKKYASKCDDLDVINYAKDIENALKTGIYSIVAHPDFFMYPRIHWSKQCEEASITICNAAKKYNVALELNIKGATTTPKIIDGTNCVPYPYRKFWEVASAYKNKVIYGWDAHSPDGLKLPTGSADNIVKGLDLSFVNDVKLVINRKFQ